MLSLRVLIIAFVFSITIVPHALAEARVALVIGNGAYGSQPLDNPPNDAALMAQTLEQVGFQVVSEINADGRAMKRAVRKFGRLLADAGEDAVGFVFYAGHGIQSKGENYMIPVDAQIEDELDVELEGVAASTLLTSLDKAGNRLNIVVMDACRNNPYKAATRSSGTGLARMDAPSGTLIAYSTAPGKVAADGRGRNSPYTRALSRAITAPGIPVEEVFKSVRVAVMDHTNQAQVPWESSSLTGSFFFVDKAPEPVAAPAPAQPDNTVELTFWNSIKDADDASLFESYLAQYPNGLFAGLANAKIGAIRKREAASAEQNDTAFFQAIQNSTNKSDFEAYLAQYPNGTFAGLARARIASIEQQQIASATRATQAPTSDPDTDFWNQVKDARTKAELQAYLDQFPNGKHAVLARARIAGIEEQRQLAALTPSAQEAAIFSGQSIGTGESGRGGNEADLCATSSTFIVNLRKTGRKWEAIFKSPESNKQFRLTGPAQEQNDPIRLTGFVSLQTRTSKVSLRGVPGDGNVLKLGVTNVTHCANVKLAALGSTAGAASANPFDGTYTLTINGGNSNSKQTTFPFCVGSQAPADKAETTFQLVNGQARITFKSERGLSPSLDITVSPTGNIEGAITARSKRIFGLKGSLKDGHVDQTRNHSECSMSYSIAKN